MKKGIAFTFILLLVLTLFNAVPVRAQTSSCTTITSSNYSGCCSMMFQTDFPDEALISRCEAYTNSSVLPQQTGGGSNVISPTGATLNTNAVSSGSPAANASNTTSGSVSNSCSAIQFKSLIDILVWIKCLISSIFIPMIFSLAFIFFLIGVIRFMAASDNAKKQDSKKYIWYGLIGLFVMVTVWGIIKLAAGIFGLDAGVPYLPTKYLNSQSTTGN
jgi:hypothetical protein